MSPIDAEKVDFGDNNATLHPYFTQPELRMLRMYSAAGGDFNFELWSVEWYVPYNATTCVQEPRQLLKVRHLSNVSDVGVYFVSLET